MMKELDVIDRLPEALERCLQNAPRSSVVRIDREVRLANGMMADLVVVMKVLGRIRTLVVEAKSSGQPLRTREAADQLKRMIAGSGLSDAYPVVVAPYISEASAGICREYDVGYLDLAGNCRFAFDSVYVERASPGEQVPRTTRPSVAVLAEVIKDHPPHAERNQGMASPTAGC